MNKYFFTIVNLASGKMTSAKSQGRYGKNNGFILASTAILIFIAAASMAIVLQYGVAVSSSIKSSSQTLNSLNSSSSGLSAAIDCLRGNPQILDSAAIITPSSSCVDGTLATNSRLGTNLTQESTFNVSGLTNSRGISITSEGLNTFASKTYSSSLKTDMSTGLNFLTTQQPLEADTTVSVPYDVTNRGRLSSGFQHTCYIVHSSGLYCWGANGNGRLGVGNTTPSSKPLKVGGALNGKTVSTVSAGGEHTCATTSDGELYCWGRGLYGRLGLGSENFYTSPQKVDGLLSGKNVIQVQAGYQHTCARTSEGELYCWGMGDRGRIGDGTTTNRLLPVKINIPGGGNVIDVSAGFENSCAVMENNDAYCWGENASHQTGTTAQLYPNPDVLSPAKVLGSLSWRQISFGQEHACGVTTSNIPYCWGKDQHGRLGNGQNTLLGWEATPVRPGSLSNVKEINAGHYHTCAITNDNKTYCWGRGDNGRLGISSTKTTKSPAQVTRSISGQTISLVEVGDTHSCIATSTGYVYCWGGNASGRLGDLTTSNRHYPVRVGTLPGPVELSSQHTIKLNNPISAGGIHTCNIDYEEVVYCWGGAQNGVLGNGSTSPNQMTPIRVESSELSDSRVIGMAAGRYHTCMVANDGNAYCFGLGTSGQLGNGSTSSSTTPSRVTQSAPHSFNSITNGGWHTCAVRNSTELWCWGLNSNGQLGNNTNSNSPSPVRVLDGDVFSAGGGVAKVAAGDTHTCAVTYTGDLYCWGSRANGRLGDGSTTSYSAVPIKINTPANGLSGVIFTDVSLGENHSCGVTSLGLAYCWGRNSSGALGINNQDGNNYSSPQLVQLPSSLSTYKFSSITAGGYHSCGTMKNSTGSASRAVCWGSNSEGQGGHNTAVNQVLPNTVSNIGGLTTSKYVTSISSGNFHSCAITGDGETYCWGQGAHGRLGTGLLDIASFPTRIQFFKGFEQPKWVY